MKRTLATLLAAVLTVGLAASTAVAAPVTITNGTQFRDTNGSAVHAHGGGVLKVGSYYYWFGENRNADNTLPGGLRLPVDRPGDLGVPQRRADPVVARRAGRRQHRAAQGHLQRRPPAGT